MVFDRSENLHKYAGLGAGFETAIRFLDGKTSKDFAPGKIAIDGDRVYASVREADLTGRPERWEAHRRYADIQMILEGSEAVVYAPETDDEPSVAYDAVKDVVFYAGVQGTRCTLYPGDFMILLPGELHAPDRPEGADGFSKKLVVKVLMED